MPEQHLFDALIESEGGLAMRKTDLAACFSRHLSATWTSQKLVCFGDRPFCEWPVLACASPPSSHWCSRLCFLSVQDRQGRQGLSPREVADGGPAVQVKYRADWPLGRARPKDHQGQVHRLSLRSLAVGRRDRLSLAVGRRNLPRPGLGRTLRPVRSARPG